MKKLLTAILTVMLAAMLSMPCSVLAAGAPAAPNCNIVYDFGGGNTYTINAAIAMSLMRTNADGSYYIDPATNYYALDPEKLLAFLNALQVMYPQQSTSLDFWTTTDGLVHFAGSAYNTCRNRYLNVPREFDWLPQAIMSGTSVVRQPEMSVGNTYVEIDISSQHLYYYENLILKLESNIVTGNLSARHNTPTGVYYLRARQTNQVLTGANYASHVDYWMPIIGNSIGLHDATWRRSFGGQIYKTNGSHGCINMPHANAQALYNMIQVGTPVVVHE